MKFIMVSVVTLMLASCAMSQSSDVIVTKPEVVMHPATILRCGGEKLPKHFRSNKEVARSYIRLWKHNEFCHNNMDGVKKYLNDAQQDIDNTPSK